MVHFFHGPDEFAIAEAVAEIKAQLGDPATAALNTSVVEGHLPVLAEVRSLCETMPFLADHRLIIIEGWLTRLLGKNEGAEDGEADTPGNAKETLAALAGYLGEVPDTAVLVLTEKRTIPDRNVVLKALAGHSGARVRLFEMPQGEALVKWVLARARAEGGQFKREAAQALAAIENDPRALGQEIRKLLTYVDFARPVEQADVEMLTPAGGEARIFDLVDAVGQRKGPVALRELHKLLEQEDPFYILSMIIRQFRLMLQAKELLADRASETDIARTLGLHPFPTQKICAQSRAYTMPALEQIYHRLLECDLDLKTGRMEPAAALDLLVISLTP